MLTLSAFSGINNVLPVERLGENDLRAATNVDIGLSGELSLRSGYTQTSSDAHRNLHAADGFMLATVGVGGDLTTIVGATRTVIRAAIGHARMWYCDLPDGKVAYSNGTVSGIASASGSTAWGVSVPAAIGALTEVAGNLFPGDYQYQLTHVRLSDGREGGAAYSGAPVALTEGGVFLSGLPVLAGHKTNVYLTSHNGGEAYLAGSTTSALFTYTGANDALVLPCRTNFMQPAPAGRCLAFWRGRALVAKDNVLYASLPNQWETFDVRRDTKQFIDPITAVIPVDDGIYVGTEKELAYLAGTAWDGLQYRKVLSGPVVLGSGVSVHGDLVQQGEGAALGRVAICIADGGVVTGFNNGGLVRRTEGRYHTDVAEVHAHFRMNRGTPQYVAVPR